jgi:hypothetical protein
MRHAFFFDGLQRSSQERVLQSMRIFELTCGDCGAAYNVAESATIEGSASDLSCKVCGGSLAHLEGSRFRVCRLEVSAEHPYFYLPRDAPEPLASP